MSTPTTTNEPPTSSSPQPSHTLPRWVLWLQDNLFLTALLLAEAYLLGTLMALGWVRDLQEPQTWGYYGGVGVILFFAAGAMAAGVALRCSVTAAAAFREHRWGFALFNFVGLLLFAAVEIWASLSERSANLRPTPADTAVLQLLGVSSLPVSPTVVVVALLLPFSTLYWGFSQRVSTSKPAIESDEERSARMADEEARARHAATLSAIKAAGARQTFQAIRGKVDPLHLAGLHEQTDEVSTGNGGDDDGPVGVGFSEQSTGTDGAVSTGKPPAASQAGARITRIGVRPKGYMTASELVGWVSEVCARNVTEDQARGLIKATAGHRRLEGETGQPWAAPKASLTAQARKLWGAVPESKAQGL